MRFLIFLLLIFTALNRLFLIGQIPTSVSQTVLDGRLLSAAASIVSMLLLFLLVKNYFGSLKIALLASWVFSVLPWAFEQGRVISGPNLALVLVLFVLWFRTKVKNKFRPFLFLIIPFLIYVSYPQFWLFRISGFELSLDSFLKNLFLLTSFDFLFFKNITFWWGGIREFGIMLLTFLPFFLIGLYKLITCKEWKLAAFYGILIITSVLSPFFPESREFYFAAPLISLTVALGFYQLPFRNNLIFRVLILSIIIVVIYEISQFDHFYFIHYPQQVLGNFSKINEAF